MEATDESSPSEVSADAKAQAILKSLAAQLSEHFESVQIVAVRNDADRSMPFHHGEGSVYSRYGAMKEWVVRQERLMLRGLNEV